MADLVNPYANPYLPSFVNQRPRINDIKPVPTIPTVSMPTYSQIHSVNGYSGARDYVVNNLTPGSSDIVAEADPNTARIYIVAKDQTGQPIVEGYRLTHEDEPKPITMDDLNTKMSEILERMNKLEEQNNAKSDSEPVWEISSAVESTTKSAAAGKRDGKSTTVSATNGSK